MVIIILCIFIAALTSYIVYDKLNLEKSTIKDSNNDKDNLEKINIIEEFEKFTANNNLKNSNDIYDWNALHSKNCVDAINATGNEYSLELFTFKDNDSAKKEYINQNNYQLQVNNVKQVISSKNEDNYDYYEAILIPNLDNSPAANGDEQIYLFQLRIYNFYISFYESSTNSNKDNMIKIVKELKTVLGIE